MFRSPHHNRTERKIPAITEIPFCFVADAEVPKGNMGLRQPHFPILIGSIILLAFVAMIQPSMGAVFQRGRDQNLNRVNYGVLFKHKGTINVFSALWYHTFGITLPPKENLFVNPGLESFHRVLQQPCPPPSTSHRNTREAPTTESALKFEGQAPKRTSPAPSSPAPNSTEAPLVTGAVMSSQVPTRPDPAALVQAPAQSSVAHVTRFENPVPRRPVQIKCNHWHENMKFLEKVYTEGHDRIFTLSQAIHQIIPAARSATPSPRKRALLPGVGVFLKSVFGTSTLEDEKRLDDHVRQMAALQDSQTRVLKKSLDDMSSFMITSAARTDGLVQAVRESTLTNIKLVEETAIDVLQQLKYVNNITFYTAEVEHALNQLERSYADTLWSGNNRLRIFKFLPGA